MNEADFQRAVIEMAQWRKWRVAHYRPARTDRGWRTPLEGHPGAPDLILARDGQVLLAELKSDSGRVTSDQNLWLDAAGPHGRLWRPGDLPAITEELA